MSELPPTYAKFAAVADELVAQKERPTLRAVLQRAGSGSMRDVSAAMAIWRQRSRPLAEVSTKAPEALLATVEKLWEEAYARAMARVEEERRALAAASAQTQAQMDEVTELAELFESERDALKLKLEQVTSERDTAKETAASMQTQLQAYQAMFSEHLQASQRSTRTSGKHTPNSGKTG